MINDEIDFNLVNAEREQAAGSFNVDLVTEEDSGNPVIIEYQIGKSDHGHLGKVITYMTSIGANKAI